MGISPYAKSIKHKPWRENGLRSLGMTQADNIRPYAIGVKYKILRDDVGIVPYVIYIINCSQNPNMSNKLNMLLLCSKSREILFKI